jgi:DNA primase
MKRAMRCPDGWDSLAPYQREALEMIAQKISRALHGNPHEVDHWRDIAGYATLVVNELEG